MITPKTTIEIKVYTDESQCCLQAVAKELELDDPKNQEEIIKKNTKNITRRKPKSSK